MDRPVARVGEDDGALYLNLAPPSNLLTNVLHRTALVAEPESYWVGVGPDEPKP